ncbi:MAG: efflux RND transporter periplasmic adaptor subunit [Magnetococcales bacterium]|nr:efflux RND transporter periplasmic adaptor subunit [Magnetococcales bacterium]
MRRQAGFTMMMRVLCALGMAWVGPVWSDPEDASKGVRIDPERLRSLGVTSEAVGLRPVVRTIRAVGTVQVDERRLHVVTQKYEGWIEKLHADVTGQSIQRGQPLMEVYAPTLVQAQQEYLAAQRAGKALKEADPETRRTADDLAESALNRLRNWDFSAGQIKRLQQQQSANKNITVFSPLSGVILEKNAIQGMRFMPGEVLYRIADLSMVWVLADVFEQDMGLVREGQTAEVTLTAMPGKVFSGKVAFVYPTLTAETRTVKVRIELPNPTGQLRPALYATVLLAAPTAENGRLITIPDSALLENGSRQMVLVERNEAGWYEPRVVRVGAKSDGSTEILAGLKAGEKVVVQAKTLLDAEPQLKGALGH